MEFLKEIKKKTLLIVDNSLKERVLEEINALDTLVDVKLMTKEEFLKHYFFDYKEEAIYYICSTYHLTVKNAKMYLENLKFVLSLDSKLEKVIFLKKMYKDLESKDLLIKDLFFKEYLKNVDIKVLNTFSLDPFYLNLLSLYHPTYVTISKNKSLSKPRIYHFKTIEEECAFVFDQISSLVKTGISLKNIKLMNATSEYLPFLKRMSRFYHLKINNLEKISIYGTTITNQFLSMIEQKKEKEEILSWLKPHLDKEIYMHLFTILNCYYFVDSLYEVMDLIKEDLKKTYFKPLKYKEAIELLPLNSYLTRQDDFVFLLGFNLENIPITYKDLEYLNDSLKNEIGLFTSLEKNKLEHIETVNHLKNISNLTITYKDTDPYKSYYPSNLIEELEIPIEEIESENSTSDLYNKIKLTNQLDTMLKYGVLFPNTSKLFNTYKEIPYLTYNNQFTGLNSFFPDKIILSYTSLNTYYHCAFRYYIDNILKLNVYEDSFKIYIGNLFHYILSKMFDESFDYSFEFTNYIKEKKFTKKEQFYLKLLKEEMENVIEVIRYQHKLSGLNQVKLETNISLTYQNKYLFKGIIDKMMYKEKEGVTYLSLIDYKTGTPKTDMTNLIYGIDMQLPIYFYLVKKGDLFKNPQIIGFYFQQILHEKSAFSPKKTSDEVRKDNLKLYGYTINDPTLVNMFDESYENSEMIKGMKVTSKGFSHYTKVLTEEALNQMTSVVDLKIKEAFKKIEEGDFSINPKIIGGENIGCLYCKYKDLCFKTGNDFVYLKEKNDLSYLDTKKEGESCQVGQRIKS